MVHLNFFLNELLKEQDRTCLYSTMLSGNMLRRVDVKCNRC